MKSFIQLQETKLITLKSIAKHSNQLGIKHDLKMNTTHNQKTKKSKINFRLTKNIQSQSKRQ